MKRLERRKEGEGRKRKGGRKEGSSVMGEAVGESG